MSTKRVDLRLDDDVIEQVYKFQYEHGMDSPSTAIRALLEIALRDLRTLEAALSRSAWRESTRRASKKLREEVDKAVARSLGAIDEAAETPRAR